MNHLQSSIFQASFNENEQQMIRKMQEFQRQHQIWQMNTRLSSNHTQEQSIYGNPMSDYRGNTGNSPINHQYNEGTNHDGSLNSFFGHFSGEASLDQVMNMQVDSFKQEIQVDTSDNKVSLDPTEERILFGSDNNIWDAFGKSSENPENSENPWSALMQSAVGEISESEIDLHEDLNVQNILNDSCFQNNSYENVGGSHQDSSSLGLMEGTKWSNSSLDPWNSMRQNIIKPGDSNSYELNNWQNVNKSQGNEGAEISHCKNKYNKEEIENYNKRENTSDFGTQKKKSVNNNQNNWKKPSPRKFQYHPMGNLDDDVETPYKSIQSRELLHKVNQSRQDSLYQSNELQKIVNPSEQISNPSHFVQKEAPVLSENNNELIHQSIDSNVPPGKGEKNSYSHISPQMAPSWFNQYGTFKNHHILPTYDHQKAIDTKTIEQPLTLNSNLTSPKKRKRDTYELVPWHKEVSQGHENLHTISIGEENWAKATNRLVETVKEEGELNQGSHIIRAKKRLILTTQLMQQLFNPPQLVNTDYENIAYTVSRLALRDCLNLSQKSEMNLFKVVQGFVKKTQKLEKDFSRLNRRGSILDLRVESQEVEKICLINRFAKFHSTKMWVQKYVIAVPIPKNLPDRVQCLSL